MKKTDWIYVDEYRRRNEENTIHQLYFEGKWINIQLGIEDNETFCKTIV